jgi:hypothetical protein
VAFFGNLPGDVADQARERDEEKFALFHFSIRKPVPHGGPALILVATPPGIVTVCLNSPGSVGGVRQPRHGGAGITHVVVFPGAAVFPVAATLLGAETWPNGHFLRLACPFVQGILRAFRA